MARRRGPVGPPSGKSFWQKYQWFIIAGVALFFVITVIAPALTNTPEQPEETNEVTAPDAVAGATVPGEFYFKSTSAEHIPVGSRGSGYASDPPTSGQHWSEQGLAPISWGLYSDIVPDEVLIHNMEHGGIIAYYRPSAPPAEVEQLRQFMMAQPGYPKGYIVAPRATLPADITLAAWEYYLPLFQYNEATITSFINAHYDQGPETVDGQLR